MLCVLIFEHTGGVMSTYSDRIFLRMNELGLSQTEISKATGAARSTVHGWLNNVAQPSGQRLLLLAATLKTSADWILTGKNPAPLNNFKMQEFINKHNLANKDESSFDVENIQEPIVAEYSADSEFIWIDVVEANFSCGVGESIEFHFDVVNGKLPFPPSFFARKKVAPECMRIIKAKGDSMSSFIHDEDYVGIDISQTDVIDGEVYAVYFAGEGMLKQIFKEADGSLILHSYNEKYRDKVVTEQNGHNFKVMGRQFWRAG